MDLGQRMGVNWQILAECVRKQDVQGVVEYVNSALAQPRVHYRIIQRCLEEFCLSQVRHHGTLRIRYTVARSLKHWQPYVCEEFYHKFSTAEHALLQVTNSERLDFILVAILQVNHDKQHLFLDLVTPSCAEAARCIILQF
jgi:hypothetical protein